jgi:Cu/Ag efflux pump CusA
VLGYRIRAREQEGMTGPQTVLEVTRERTVPVLQSVLITAGVLAPLAILGTQPGLEFLHPMAVTMLGGLVSLLLVQLFVLPALLLTTAGQPAPEQQGPGQPGLRPGRPQPHPGQPDPGPRAPEVKAPRPATGAAPG